MSKVTGFTRLKETCKCEVSKWGWKDFFKRSALVQQSFGLGGGKTWWNDLPCEKKRSDQTSRAVTLNAKMCDSFFHMTSMISLRWKESIWKSIVLHFQFCRKRIALVWYVSYSSSSLWCIFLNFPRLSVFVVNAQQMFFLPQMITAIFLPILIYKRRCIFKMRIFVSRISQSVQHHGKGFWESTWRITVSRWLFPNPHLITVRINALNLRK